MKNITRFLRFLRLTDESNNISITNVLIVALGIKIMLMPVIDVTIMIGFVMSLLQYGHKRHIMLDSTKDEKATKDTIIAEAREEMDLMSAKVVDHTNNAWDKLSEHIEQSDAKADKKSKRIMDIVVAHVDKSDAKLLEHDDIITKLKTASGFKTIGQ